MDGKLVRVTWLCLSGCSCWLLSWCLCLEGWACERYSTVFHPRLVFVLKCIGLDFTFDVWCIYCYIIIYYYIIYYYTYTHTYSLYYTHLIFSPSFPIFISSPQSSLPIFLSIPSSYSFYTCRELVILIYIPTDLPNSYPTILIICSILPSTFPIFFCSHL